MTSSLIIQRQLEPSNEQLVYIWYIYLLPLTVPSPPHSLMAVDVGSSTVSLTWLPPAEPNGILLFYQVVARQVEGNTEDILVDVPANMSTADLLSANTSASDMVEVTANRSDMSMTNTTEDLPMTSNHVAFALSSLSPHTDYVITVVANTSAGYGNRSEELHIQTSKQYNMNILFKLCECVCVCMRVWMAAGVQPL